MWYAFRQWNGETRYGWTTNPDVAEAGLRALNGDRENNLYSMVELSESDDEADDSETPLSKRDIGYVFTDDTHLDADGNLYQA